MVTPIVTHINHHPHERGSNEALQQQQASLRQDRQGRNPTGVLIGSSNAGWHDAWDGRTAAQHAAYGSWRHHLPTL